MDKDISRARKKKTTVDRKNNLIKKLAILLTCWTFLNINNFLFASLKIDKKSVYLKKAVRGQKLRHKFLISNPSKKDILIRMIHQPCSCTHILGEEKTLYPAHSKNIPFEVELDSSQLRGRVSKKIYLHTSAASNKYIILTLRADIEEEFSLKPPVLDLRSQKSLDPNKIHTILIKLKKENSIQFLKAEQEDGFFKLALSQESPKLYKLQIQKNQEPN